MRILPVVAAALVSVFSTVSAQGHEFWLDPVAYRLQPGKAVIANIRVGQDFSGGAYSYLPRSFNRFEMALGQKQTPVTGRTGDIPAVDMKPLGEGLHVLLESTGDTKLRYKDMETFESFVTHKDFAWALKDHADRGLPDAGFIELYSRHAKALVQVGEGGGQDREFGLPTEIVARANPYVDDISGGLPVTVLYQGKPRQDTQVEVFEKAPDDSVTSFMLRTDDAGQTVVPVKPGHRYLVDAVVMRQPEAAKVKLTEAVWESLWASLTFQAPE